MKRLLTSAILTFFCVLFTWAQERTITGKVLDGDLQGEPLVGATITVDGAKVAKGAVTDINGHYSITIDHYVKKLVVKYMGYEQQTITLKPG